MCEEKQLFRKGGEGRAGQGATMEQPETLEGETYTSPGSPCILQIEKNAP